ncbi:C40 family peptidase [Streptomyces sp. ISL-11]|uniref:C40 family peptidase n=1 Tax=Streptomyces sp. ISL-11 TaxID=2819174 RepID=UPI001BE93DBB|nr:C40 family peptidase [Streptomyces sp. ISL-11]MBT2384881.1 C40 family peptidase [Streptomyces sp. ISL-11]
MASHRKPKQHPLASSTVRTAATLALAGVAGTTALEGTGHAAPLPDPAQLRARVDRSYQEAEVATERYNGAKEKADRAEAALDGLQDEAARRTERLNAARDALGSLASAQYRAGAVPESVRLLLSSSPGQFLERASLTDRAGDRKAVVVARFQRELREVRQVRTTAAGRLAELRSEQDTLARNKRTAAAKLTEARALLERLPSRERAAVERGDAADPATGAGRATALRADRPASRDAVQAPTGRAAQAVAFAYSALGKPYVWGATGPSGFDCSGLTQAAWQAAGVSLPRTTYTQINAGRRVSRGQLAPGDLVFFYSGVSHVGLYVGGGQMIHAPHPGAPVRLAPVDEMPFAGAARPA